jgi:hypothetical protein
MSSLPTAATAAALLALSACAIQPRPPTVAAPAGGAEASADDQPRPQPKVVCVNEAPTGSHIAERRCRPVDEIERERSAAQVEALRPRTTPSPKGN